jgi:prepilin-type N-terminal cleavage/methylation domain-containing protein
MINNHFRTDKPNSRAGFTLIELIIVTALLAILMAIAIPRLPMSSHRQLELAAARLAGDLRLLKSEAVASRSTCEAYFNINDNNYKLKLPDGEGYDVYLPEGITFLLIRPDTGDDAETNFICDPEDPHNFYVRYIRFNHLGGPYNPGRIVLQAEDGKKRYIFVAPSTGRVRISSTKSGS